MGKVDIKFLIGLGMKDVLLANLEATQLSDLISYAMDHINSQYVLQNLIQLASMEIRGREGAIYLASQGVATVQQLKNISKEDVKKVCDLFRNNNDIEAASAEVMNYLIMEQQEKLHSVTGGKKGEYHTLKDELDAVKNSH